MPLSELPTSTPRTDLKHCRRLLRSGSRSFFAASLLLPQPTREQLIATGKVTRDLAHFQACYRLAERYVDTLKT